jgi:isoquinoline 1-oxidoreductase subunit beta
VMKTTRRSFIKNGVIAGTGLVICLETAKSAAGSDSDSSIFEPSAYLSITPDNVIRLWVTRSEMGQGVRTTLPMMLVEELEADWSQIKFEQAMPGGRFRDIRLRTAGSGSTAGTYNALRKAGATARAMLIAAAAEKWNVDPSSCQAWLGTVVQLATGRKLTYGQLAASAARQKVPRDPPLKDPRDFRIIGKPRNRTDGKAIVTGQAVYGIDVRIPGMLHAVMARCPFIGGSVAHFDATPALAVPGVRHVLPVKSGIATGVAVVADHTWAAMRGRDALKVEWERGPTADFDSDRFLNQMHEQLSQEEDGYFVRDDGDAKKALRSAARTLQAIYEFPFQAHAPMETMNCVADVRRDSCEIWAPTQCPEIAQSETAKMLGLPEDAVKIHITLLGGGFGRRLFADYVPEAVEISRAIGKPVQVLWSRRDDMQCGFFHPSDVERITGGLDWEQRPTVWVQRSIFSDLSMFGFPDAEQRKNPKHYFEDGNPWGSFDNPYNFPHLKADLIPLNSPVPTGPWRAVFYPPTVFARESFLDEMAHAAGRDPLAFRLQLLEPGDVLNLGNQKIDRSRLARVLQVAAEESGWQRPLAQAGDRLWGRGIACNVYSQDCFVAQVAEVSLNRERDDIRVHRIVCAVDCGIVVNPTGLEGQTESGIAWGLSAPPHGKIDLQNGAAVQENFHDFEVLRMNEAPKIEIHVVVTDHAPGGFGETAVPPVAPAVANAIFAATGRRVRSLPITSDKLNV